MKNLESVNLAASAEPVDLDKDYSIQTADAEAPSTLICFQTKTELFCSGYGYRSHYKAETERSPKTESFENDLQSGEI